MQTVNLTVSQTAEKYDKAGVDSAVQLAQGKINQLGLGDFERVTLAFSIGKTEVSFAMETIPDPEPETETKE